MPLICDCLDQVREAMGLDPDHVSEFSDTDAKFNAIEVWCYTGMVGPPASAGHE